MRVVAVAAALAGLAGVTVTRADAVLHKPSPPSVVVMRPGYETPSVVDVSVRTNGVHLRGRHQSVLSIFCNGVGKTGPMKVTLGGFHELTYHRFICRVTTPTVHKIKMTVLWWSNNTYRYDFPGL